MFEFIEEYLSEFILIIGIGFLKLFGRTESAEKLQKKLVKKKKKLEKKIENEVNQTQKDFDDLEKLNKEIK